MRPSTLHLRDVCRRPMFAGKSTELLRRVKEREVCALHGGYEHSARLKDVRVSMLQRTKAL